jgi:MFS family permease
MPAKPLNTTEVSIQKSPAEASDEDSLLSLSKVEYATLFATFAGWALDGMNVMIFSFVIPTLISLWGLTRGQAGLLGTTALVVSACGGWLAGVAADRYGRVKILQVTILWFAVFAFLSGFTNSYSQLMIVRALQGLGFGGEWAVGSVLIGETIRAQHRGKAVGIVQSGWAIGWGLAALSYAVVFSLFGPATAWRVMFWIGLMPALLVFYIQKHVPEPAVFRNSGAARLAPGSLRRALEIFSPQMLRITLMAALLAVGVQGGYYAITTWLPLLLQTGQGLSVLHTGGYLSMVIVGSFLGYLTAAWLADVLGRRRTLILFAALSFVTVLTYTSLLAGHSAVFVLGFPLGFFSSGSFSPIGAFLTELFPTSMRGSGQGFAYNLGRGIGALLPALVGYLGAKLSLGGAIAWFAGGAYLLMILGVLGLPETRGRELSS